MQYPNRISLHALLLVGFATLGASAAAQQTTLYDPQPPANSAYVRVIVGNGAGDVDVSVNNRPRLSKVPLATPSPYMVLPAGEHELALKSGHQSVQVKVKAEASRSLTVVAQSLEKSHKPTVIEDKINSNRLKAIISAYNLSPNAMDVWTADGQTQVFSAVATGASASLVVNPIALAYKVSASGDKNGAPASSQIAMAPGGAYTIVISSDKAGAARTQAHANVIEKYQAKP
jgi:alginate O-acetyltransferase complex protein AlgF